MKEPMAIFVGWPIFFSSWAKRVAGKRASTHGLYSAKSKSGWPTRKLLGPKPPNADNQLSDEARFFSKDSMFRDRGATTPQPKIPTLRTLIPLMLRSPRERPLDER